MDTSARVIVGISVSEGDFWHVTGTALCCPNCAQDRPQGKHCYECGAWLKKRLIREPKPPLLALAAPSEHGDPEKTWERLTKGLAQVRIFSVEAACVVADPRIDEPPPIALGTEVLTSPNLDMSPRRHRLAPRAAQVADLKRAATTVKTIADQVGIPGEAEVFLVLGAKC